MGIDSSAAADPEARGLQPQVIGELAGHPGAPAFAREVLRIHRRYATEVVAAFRLCPFLRDVDSAFGRFCVVLDRAPDAERAVEVALAAGSSVVHLVHPCVTSSAQVFEKFAAGLAARLRQRSSNPPVMAVFHPGLSGDATTPHRLVGLLRRAPDPFVQLVPEGLHQGGTVFAGTTQDLGPDPAQQNFQRLAGAELDRLSGVLADIRRDRDASYAAHPPELGSSRW